MSKPLTILASLVRAAQNADDADVDAARAEVRAYASEPLTLATLMWDARDSVALDHYTDEGLVAHLAKVLPKIRERKAEAKRDIEGAAAQAHAETLGQTAKRTHEGYDLDVDALFACAKAGNVAGYVGFTLNGAPDENMLDVSVRQLRELAKEAKAQRWHVTAKLALDHTQVREETRCERGRPETRDYGYRIYGWSLIIEWTRASGARGTMRFRHNTTFAGKAKCAAVVHVGLAENTNAYAA